MFVVYTPSAEIPLATTVEVIRLLRRYSFELDADFFTVGRLGREYLEIFNPGDSFSLAHIPPNADLSTPVAELIDFQLVERIVTAFCDGDPNWQALLKERRLNKVMAETAPLETEVFTELREITSLARENRHTDSFHHDAPPISPQAYGCMPVQLLLVAGAVGLLLYAAYRMFAGI